MSPLSWWNDLYVNFPIAYGMACIVGLFDKEIFAAALVVCCWSTNIGGLVMLHKGLAPAGNKKGFWKKAVVDLIISVVYTGVIILLLHLGFLKLPQEYF